MDREHRRKRELLNAAWDLERLIEITQAPYSPRHVPEIAPRLYKLLIESSLQNAWRCLHAEGMPRIPARTLVLNKSNLLDRAVEGRFHCVAPRYTDDRPPVVLFDIGANRGNFPAKGPLVTVVCQICKLSKFKDSIGMFAGAEAVKRETAIKFIRNKRGGAHIISWNLTEKNVEGGFDSTARHFDPQPFEAGGLKGYSQMTNNNLNGVEEYIYNIASDITEAPDVAEFLADIRKTYPDDR